jgi:hypothetical protein
MGRLSEYRGAAIAAMALVALVAILAWLAFQITRIEVDLRDDDRPVTGPVVKTDEVSQIAAELDRLSQPPQWTSNAHRVFIGERMVAGDDGKIHPRPPDDPCGLSREGISNWWLTANGLSLHKLVADTDPYKKGFTVMEEYRAGTNPKDPSSHPDYAFKLRVRGALTQDPFPFLFTSVSEQGGKPVFSVAQRNGQKTCFVKQNEVIPDAKYPGFRIVGYAEKFTSVPDPVIRTPEGKSSMRKVDVSELTLQKEGMEPVVLIREKSAFMPGFIADLVFLLDPKLSFKVKEQSVFTLRESQYKVLGIRKLKDGTAVVTIEKLDPDGKPLEGKRFELLPYTQEEQKKTERTESPPSPRTPAPARD